MKRSTKKQKIKAIGYHEEESSKKKFGRKKGNNKEEGEIPEIGRKPGLSDPWEQSSCFYIPHNTGLLTS